MMPLCDGDVVAIDPVSYGRSPVQGKIAPHTAEGSQRLFNRTESFRYEGQNHLLADGDVIEFDALVPHGLPPVKCDRYSIQFRILQI
ncbi:MAG: hypothetical protein WBB28_19910 [Crinalium sp.]